MDRSRIIHAVNGVSFDIAPGGDARDRQESGCGKSVTSLALLGILPRAGRVDERHGALRRPQPDRSPDEELRTIRGKDIAMIFRTR